MESYAKIVRDKYDLRTLMQAARNILSDASAGEQDASLLLDSAEQRIYDIRRGKSTQGLQSVREILLETEQGMLMIRGNELHVNRLTLDKGEVDIDGRIDSLVYSDTAASGEKQESFLGRLFR